MHLSEIMRYNLDCCIIGVINTCESKIGCDANGVSEHTKVVYLVLLAPSGSGAASENLIMTKSQPFGATPRHHLGRITVLMSGVSVCYLAKSSTLYKQISNVCNYEYILWSISQC